MKIINKKPNGKFLIFSNYYETFDEIIKKLNDNHITHSKVSGTNDLVRKTINNFDNGNIKVLMLNAR